MIEKNYAIGKYKISVEEQGARGNAVTVEHAGKKKTYQVPNDPEFINNDFRSFPKQVVVSPRHIRIGTEVVNFPKLTADGADARQLGGLAQTLATATPAKARAASVGAVSSNRAPELRVHIRWMIRRDMPEVLSTEQKCFPSPWEEEDFLRCLRQRNCIGMVAEHGEKVVAFMIYELHKNKLELINFAVDPAVQSSGVGSQLVAKLVSKLSSHRRTEIDLVVRETNLDAQVFFRGRDFKPAGMVRGHFDDTGEDAIRMRYRLAGAGDQPE